MNPFSLAVIHCYQCGKPSPIPRVRFTCPHCGFVPKDPAEKPEAATRRAKPVAATSPEAEDAVAILGALGIRAADARALVARAALAGIRGDQAVVTWCCRARREPPAAETI